MVNMIMKKKYIEPSINVLVLSTNGMMAISGPDVSNDSAVQGAGMDVKEDSGWDLFD